MRGDDSEWGRAFRNLSDTNRQPMRMRRMLQSPGLPQPPHPALTPSHPTLTWGGGCECGRVLLLVRGDLCLSAAAEDARLGRRFISASWEEARRDAGVCGCAGVCMLVSARVSGQGLDGGVKHPLKQSEGEKRC